MSTVFTSFRLPALFALATAGTIGFAQEPQPPVDPQEQQAPATGGWRRVTDPPPATARNTAPPQEDPTPAPTANEGGYRPLDAYGQGREAAPPASGARPAPASQYRYTLPSELTIRPGTYLTVRVDQMLSSDRNHAGDGFSATLVKPLVIDGVVVAERGQTLGGRVVEAQKAGRVEGVSRLAVELIDLPLVDGQQLPVKTQFVSQTGGTSKGRDLAGVGGTTALGAAVGAAAAGGFGAGVGAASGAFVGLIGVLATRGHASVIYPESVVTFRVEAPLTISTVHAPQAFRFVSPGDYQRADSLQQRAQAQAAPRLVTPAPYYYSPYYYGGYYDPFFWGSRYYWGPGIGFYYRGGHRGYVGGGRGWRR